VAGRTKGESPIDRMMERASAALEATKYFEAERLAATALRRAHSGSDFERMARILLPLQEARRQKHQLAVDSGRCVLLRRMSGLHPDETEPGCYLFQPPLIGVDARAFRETADSQEIPVIVITREPLTREGKWPIVAVNGSISVRTRVEPPWKLERVEKNITKDAVDGVAFGAPPVQWFEAAGEALGDVALARLKPEEPAAWRVDDLLGYLDCHPDHEKLHQRLADECRLAMTQPLPEGRRHRPLLDDPFSF
jgi:hypothetical protein